MRTCGGEGVARAGGFQFHRTSDVAGTHFADLHAVLSGNGEELGQFLLILRAHVQQLHTLGDLAADYAEIADFTYMLFYRALEDEEYRRTCRVCRYVVPLGIRHGRTLVGVRCDLDDELHDALRADVPFRRGAEDGHPVAVGDTHAESLADFVGFEVALFEIGVHQSFVVFRCSFQQCLMQFCGPFGMFGRYGQLFARAVVVLEAEHLHEQYVDEGIEAGARVDRILYDNRFHFRESGDALQGSLPVGLLAVELVYHADQRDVVCLRITRLYLAPHFETVLRIEQHQSDIGHLERREKAAAEVVGTGSVYDVQLVVHELRVEYRGVDASPVGVFEVRVVGEGVFVLYAAPAVNDFSFESHRLSKGSLPRAGGAEQDHVFNL